MKFVTLIQNLYRKKTTFIIYNIIAILIMIIVIFMKQDNKILKSDILLSCMLNSKQVFEYERLEKTNDNIQSLYQLSLDLPSLGKMIDINMMQIMHSLNDREKKMSLIPIISTNNKYLLKINGLNDDDTNNLKEIISKTEKDFTLLLKKYIFQSFKTLTNLLDNNILIVGSLNNNNYIEQNLFISRDVIKIFYSEEIIPLLDYFSLKCEIQKANKNLKFLILIFIIFVISNIIALVHITSYKMKISLKLLR